MRDDLYEGVNCFCPWKTVPLGSRWVAIVCRCEKLFLGGTRQMGKEPLSCRGRSESSSL